MDEAIATVSADSSSTFLAGGTTEIDLIRLGVTRPDVLVDINSLPLKEIHYAHDAVCGSGRSRE